MTPGKWLSKNWGRLDAGSLDKESKWSAEAKRVQVKEPSDEGMAMNMTESAGQMWRWLGSMAKPPFSVVGRMWNSHQSLSMYSCW